MKWTHSLVLSIGLGTCLLAPGVAQAEQVATTEPPASEYPYKYQATFYQVTAAEREALCLQTYHSALRVITNKLFDGAFVEKDGRLYEEVWITDANGEMHHSLRPAAIILDVDETVVDNSEYACWCAAHPEYEEGSLFDYFRYQSELEQPATVPGAVFFIKVCQALGITPLFVTDRPETLKPYTVATLRHAGINSPTLEENVYCRNEAASKKAAQMVMAKLGMQPDDAPYTDCFKNASNKALRRFILEANYKVLGYFGDDLYDHPVVVERDAKGEAAIAQRQEQVEINVRHFGRDWFVLPNSNYGSWLVKTGDKAASGAEMKEMLATRCKGYHEWWQKNHSPLSASSTSRPLTSAIKPSPKQ